MSIHRLDTLTIDKIAAGEVIDVPASCVKELIDNALDAGASQVIVEIELGGRNRIKVTDNGCGMSEEDVVSSIERHCTSKLKTIEDLEQLQSLGFRGEALSSIVAISKTTICSAPTCPNSSICPATVLEVHGGQIQAISHSQAPSGTSVEIKDLFYNVPARRKFLKSPRRDTQDVIKLITKLALAAPHVSFSLVADGNKLLDVEQDENFISRTKNLLEEPFQTYAKEISFSIHDTHVVGLILPPQYHRSTRASQYLIVNGRPVYSLALSSAVRLGYGTACETGKHPVFAINISLNPASIDINIHPQKREIRLADEERLKTSVQHHVSKTLFGGTTQSPLPILASSTYDFSEVQTTFDTWEERPEPTLFLPSLNCLAVFGEIALFQGQDLPYCSDGRDLLLLDLKQTMKAVIAYNLQEQERFSEPLLVPIPLECSNEEANALASSLIKLKKIGIDIRPFGPKSFLIEGLSSYFEHADVRQLVLDLLHEDCTPNAKKTTSLIVRSMRSLDPPVSKDVALQVFNQWVQAGTPQYSPDGKACVAKLTRSILKECMSKGIIDTK